MIIEVGINSYVTEAELATYALNRGITITAADTTILLIKSMDYLEILSYRGIKTIDTQPLQFPRDITSDLVPNNVKNAQIVAALLIDLGEDLQPTLGKTIIRKKTGPLETEYKDNSTELKSFTQLNLLLAPFLANSGGLKLVRV